MALRCQPLINLIFDIRWFESSMLAHDSTDTVSEALHCRLVMRKSLFIMVLRLVRGLEEEFYRVSLLLLVDCREICGPRVGAGGALELCI